MTKQHMKGVMARMKVKPGKQVEFEELARKLVEKTNEEPGVNHYHLHKNEDGQTYVFYELYEDHTAREHHLTTDHFRELYPKIRETLADLRQARSLIRLYEEEILPQGRAAVQSSLSSYRAGTVDFMTLVDAQMALNRFQGEYFGLLASYGNGVARLEMNVGRDLPVTDELRLEAS